MPIGEQEHRLAVLGGGVMGTGIATLALSRGVSVVLVDVNEAVLARARRDIDDQLRHAQLLGTVSTHAPRGDLVTTTSVTAAADVTAVVEAVTELPEAKAKALIDIADIVRPDVPLISNTSGIPIGELARSVPRPEQLIGTHFMNPAYMITMVEVVRGPHTGDNAVVSTTELLAALDRRYAIVRDSPGFVTSRLLHPLINQAAEVVWRETATVEAVDALMEGCLGHPTGPLRTADLIGLDNLVDSLNALYTRTGDENCRPCPLLLEKVDAGELGRKTGQGFYSYGKKRS